MYLPILFLLLGFQVIAELSPQYLEINIGDDTILELLRQVDAAQKSGNHELASQLKDRMNAIRSEPLPSDHDQWSVECSTSAYLDAEIIAVNDPAHPPQEIAWAFSFLDEYWKTDDGEDLPYPGDFDRFKHPDGFRILRVDYDALPAGVRRWREEEMETAEEMDRKLIAVLDGVAFFAPGVVTYLMPLFATADVVQGHSACENELIDLKNYHDPANRRTDSARFVFRYGGRSQVGNSIRVQTVAQKEIKDRKANSEKDEL